MKSGGEAGPATEMLKTGGNRGETKYFLEYYGSTQINKYKDK